MVTLSLDLDGTLLAWTQPFEAVFTDAVTDAGVDADPDALLDAYGHRFHDAFGQFHPDPFRHAFAGALDHVGADADPDALATAFRAAEVAAVEPPAGTHELLDALGERHDLAVLTNGVPDLQRRKLRDAGLADRVDAVVTSYDIGAHKPAREAFDAVREALPADEYVHAGDDEDEDVVGAREAGFRAVHVDGDLRDSLVGAGLLD